MARIISESEAEQMRMDDKRTALRDHFAGLAMQQTLADELGPNGIYGHVCEESASRAARIAYEVADAMLKAREAKP